MPNVSLKSKQEGLKNDRSPHRRMVMYLQTVLINDKLLWRQEIVAHLYEHWQY